MYLAIEPQNRFESHADAITRGEAATPPVVNLETGLILVPKAIAARLEARAGCGRPMSARLLHEVGLATSVDIRGARLHGDREAARLCRALGARAFALAGDVYVDEKLGEDVLRHELAHVAQWATALHRKSTPVIRRMIDFTPPPPQNFPNWCQGLQQNAQGWWPIWIANNPIFQIDPPTRPGWIGSVLRLPLNYRQSRNHIIPFYLIQESLVGGLNFFFGNCLLACGQIDILLTQQNNVIALQQALQNNNLNLNNLVQPNYNGSRPEGLRGLFRNLQVAFPNPQQLPLPFQPLYRSLSDFDASIVKLNYLVDSLYTIHRTEAFAALHLAESVRNACTTNFAFPRLLCDGVLSLLDLLMTALNSSPDNVRGGNARLNQVISSSVDAEFLLGLFQDPNGFQAAGGLAIQPNENFYRLAETSRAIVFEFMLVAPDLMGTDINFIWNYDPNNPNNRVQRYPLHVPLSSTARPLNTNQAQNIPVVVYPAQHQNLPPFRFG